MTTTEIRKLIAESNNTEWFTSADATITISIVGMSQNLKGLATIHKFLSQQISGFDKYEDLPSCLSSSRQQFVNLEKKLVSFVTSYHNHSGSTLNSQWRNVKNGIEQDIKALPYDSPQCIFVVDLHKKRPQFTDGAYSYFTKSGNLNTHQLFTGAILAYEHELKDHTDIPKRRNSEKRSISAIRNDLREQLKEADTQLIDHLNSSKEEVTKYSESLDRLIENKENNFESWFEGDETVDIVGVKQKFAQFQKEKKDEYANWFIGTSESKGVKDRIAELENIYEERLRLKKPAEYWKNRAKVLKKEGWKCIYGLMTLVLIAAATLYCLLWLTPEGMTKSFDISAGNAGTAIRWSVIYVTFISFLAYGIRVLYKIAFSSFHLSRDAEEREQLTYVYLSLLNENSVEENDRNLILQSLFSRAETGLLKGDSSPAMPNDITGKFFGKT